ncbi:unnamed protein product [Brassicogethes aeneus]|uniref:dolichyl-phosphate-mannose--protein mannosyltransferase n=1 Tax=Brassicogethes aeneus TaxID=1431903 RepID=A0A9P0FKA5_BRAAE|nr:unnamed protein product [Brassicogethes aeneus]
MFKMRSQKYVSISVAAFFCYCNTLWGSFVFDDSEAILKNKDVLPSTPVATIFQNDFWGGDIALNSSHKSFRPLTILSYRLNVLYSNNKLDAFQFHATNVILYGLLCLLSIPVFELFFKKRKTDKDDIRNEAYWSTLLFTVHPVHTEAVAGLVGRADILSSVLFFAVLLLYSRIIQKKGSLLVLVMFVFLLVCAVLCKETAITVLGVCPVYDLFYMKKRRKPWSKMLSKGFLIRNIFLVMIGVVIMFFRFKIMNFEGPMFTHIDNPAGYCQSFLTKILTYNYIYFLNILLLIWPQWLCFDWSMGCIPLVESMRDTRFIFVFISWVVILYFTQKLIKIAYYKDTLDIRVMAVALMVLPFLPASNLFLKVGFVIAERALLLPSAGFCLLIVLGLKKIEKMTNTKTATGVLYSVLLIFAFRTVLRNLDWLSEERLFSSGLDVCPLNAKVHYNVAKIAADRHNRDLAIVEYRNAIKLNPEYEQAMNNLANLLREDEKFEEAEELLRQAVKVRPNFAAAWMNLGIVLTNLNQIEEAEHCYKMAIMHRNKYPDCYYNLGNLYLDMNRHKEALKSWEMAALYKPTHVAAWSNTLVLLDSMERYDEVLEMGRTALMYNPKAPTLHFSIANTLGKIKDFPKAEGHFLEAINFSPTNALYHSNLGVLYHRWGKIDKARDMYRKAMHLDPTLRSPELNLRKLSQAK